MKNRMPITLIVAAAVYGLVVISGLALQPVAQEQGIGRTGNRFAALGQHEEEASTAVSEDAAINPPGAPIATLSVAQQLQEKGLVLTLLGIFIAGILLSFTPCVYPMIPITLGLIGARGEGKPLKGLALSSVFVLGIAITYSVLGVAAALSGSLFGGLMQSKIVLLAIVLIFGAMALSMFGLYDIYVPSAVSSKLEGKKKKGFVGALVLGMVAGIVASPCSSPVLASLLVYVSTTQNPVQGFVMFFTFAIGIGLLFIALGTFPSFLGALPKAGVWMVEVKKFFGLLLLGVAFYYLRFVLSQQLFIYFLLIGVILILLGVFAGAFIPLVRESTGLEKLHKALGIVFLVAGIALLFDTLQVQRAVLKPEASPTGIAEIEAIETPRPSLPSSSETPPPEPETPKEIGWLRSEPEGLELARQLQKPIMIDFYADWCPPCVKFDRQTFTDQRVIQALARFVAIRVDLTEVTEEGTRLAEKYGVAAIPTILFLKPTGEVLPEFTINGFTPPDEFLTHIKEIP
jgi:thiol:disulfide interchange protein DsbD